MRGRPGRPCTRGPGDPAGPLAQGHRSAGAGLSFLPSPFFSGAGVGLGVRLRFRSGLADQRDPLWPGSLGSLVSVEQGWGSARASGHISGKATLRRVSICPRPHSHVATPTPSARVQGPRTSRAPSTPQPHVSGSLPPWGNSEGSRSPPCPPGKSPIPTAPAEATRPRPCLPLHLALAPRAPHTSGTEPPRSQNKPCHLPADPARFPFAWNTALASPPRAPNSQCRSLSGNPRWREGLHSPHTSQRMRPAPRPAGSLLWNLLACGWRPVVESMN